MRTGQTLPAATAYGRARRAGTPHALAILLIRAMASAPPSGPPGLQHMRSHSHADERWHTRSGSPHNAPLSGPQCGPDACSPGLSLRYEERTSAGGPALLPRAGLVARAAAAVRRRAAVEDDARQGEPVLSMWNIKP